MRVRLFPGKQKELFYSNKAGYGKTWREMADDLGDKDYQVRDWGSTLAN